MTSASTRFPNLFEGGRKAAFSALALLAAVEAGSQFASVWTIRNVIDASGDEPLKLALLAGTFGTLGLAYWARSVLAEAIGQGYVNDVRTALARQAIESALGRGRLGTVSVRMSADLLSLKNWADLGVCGGISGSLTLAAGLASAGWTLGPGGFVAASAGPAFSLILAAVLSYPLNRAIRLRRRARGLLSARTGDSVLSARVAATYNAFKRFIGPVRRAGKKVADASIREQAVVQLLKASALLTVPLGVCLQVLAPGGAPAGANWAALLFALGLCAAGTLSLSTAFGAFLEQRIARGKLLELEAQAQAAPRAAPNGQTRLRPSGAGAALRIDGVEIVAAGQHLEMWRSEASAWLGRVRSGDEGVEVSGTRAQLIAARDWARRIAVVSPDLPILRGMLTDVLAAQSEPRPDRMVECLAVAGLSPDQHELNSLIDPYKDDVGEPILARLRLARALVHRPLVVIVDEASLFYDRELRRRVEVWAERTGTSRVWIEPD